LIKAAKKQGVSIQVVEWPGGEPENIKMEITPKLFGSINKGVMNITLPKDCNLAEMAGLPWGTVVTFKCNDQELNRIVGPAIYQKSKWILPVQFFYFDQDTSLAIYHKESEKIRKLHGFLPTNS
jgi:hypothetical protein